MTTSQRPVSCGLDLPCATNLNDCLFLASSSKFEFICISLVHPLLRREFAIDVAKHRPFTRPDIILQSSDWSNLIIGKFSPFINVDSRNKTIRRNSEEALNQELSLATHFGLSAVTFKLNGGINKNINFARIMCDKLATNCIFQAWVQVPMEDPIKQSYSYREESCPPIEDPWEWWNAFRVLCDYNKKLGVALIVSHDLPNLTEIDRWVGEPVRCLILPTTLFLTNKKGYPVLSRAHQTLVKRFATLQVQFILTGATRYKSISYYHNYLDYLWKGCQNNDTMQTFACGYEDYLQCPLQPLSDNLESQTYEIFEKDPVKYREYQNAIYEALKEIKMRMKEENRPIVIMVVGAGRGPLVNSSLNAAKMASQEVKIYAVEKNPNAVLTLQVLEKNIWKEQVTVISCDMREWNPPEKADIIVSELLGSFGDNELSPECLDNVLQYLRDDGINIPQSYTSFIAPIQSSKLYNEVKQLRDKDKPPLTNFETPYVVHLQNKYDICAPQPLFTFLHPNKDVIIDNSRYAVKTFEVKQNCVLHGFSGYFDAVLYENIILSIEPETSSPDMFSWFPIFFPLKEPVHLLHGDKIEVHFWRKCDSRKVWYEWCLTKPFPVSIHNSGGRSYTIGL